MQDKGYWLIEHTADAGIEAFGRDLPELFTRASLAILSIIINPSSVAPSKTKEIHLEGMGLDDLMVRWLNELIFLFDAEQLLLSEFSFKRIDATSLDVVCHGETVETGRHQLRTGIKAATYHRLELIRVEDFWRTRVYLDL